MYIIGFNGPPESGKDTLAEMVADYMDRIGVNLPVKMESLSYPLRKAAYALVDWPGELDGPDYADFKTTEFSRLGVTGRRLMIDVSESFLKPVFGQGVMAQLLLERNEGFHGIMLIRDSGFQCEIDPLANAVRLDNLAIVQVHRPGKTFEGDSREWVHAPHVHRQYGVSNDQSLDHLRLEAERIVNHLLNQCGWKL